MTVLANLGSGIVATDGVIECDLRMPPETGRVEGSLEEEEESLSSLDEYAASILSLKFFQIIQLMLDATVAYFQGQFYHEDPSIFSILLLVHQMHSVMF